MAESRPDPDATQKVPPPSDETVKIQDPTLRGLVAGQKVFGRYTLEAVAGRGGMGVVWRARDEVRERTVAIKFLPEAVAADPEAVRDLKHETNLSLELTHPHIVRVYDFLQDHAAAGIAMEFIDGESLAKRKATAPGGCLAAAELAPLVAQLCSALDYAHQKARVVHRDLKPANLLVTRGGDLRVTDFGISRSLSETHTRLTGTAAGSVSGTLPYMSPEQLAGDNPRATDDIYALGATLYELLAGKPPFYRGDPYVLMKQIGERAPAPLAQHRAEAKCAGAPIPVTWEKTILACLAKRAEDRPRSAGEVLRRLEGGEADLDKTEKILATPAKIATEDETVKIPPPRAKPSRRSLWLGLAAAVALLAGVGWYFGSYAPEQNRLAAEREKTRQIEAEANRLAQQKILTDQAEQARLAREREASAVEAKRVEAQKVLAEQQRLAAARGGIIVRTTPPGAEVTVGALENATSPVTVKDVRLGKYPVTIRLAGYEEEKRDVEVKENEFTTLDLALVRSTGALSVASNPPGLEAEVAERVSVSVDRESLTASATRRAVKTPVKLEKLPTGDYDLTFRREGWPEQKQNVAIARNATATALAEFLGGNLEITSAPSGAEVFSAGRDGAPSRPLGKTPLRFDDVPPSTYAFEFRLKGYKTASARGEIVAKQTARASAVLEKQRGAEAGSAWTIPEINLTLMPIAAGAFTMGSPDNEEGRFSDESPQTQVTITRPYWLGRTEVTQGQWAAVMGSNPSNFKGEDLPVEQVTWTEAMEFCRKVTERERAAGRMPEGYEYTLPSEAQWEYACRAGTSGPYAGSLDAMGWYGANSGSATHAVGTKRANAWGLYDMHGNVWES